MKQVECGDFWPVRCGESAGRMHCCVHTIKTKLVDGKIIS